MTKTITIICALLLAGCGAPVKLMSSSPRTVQVQSFKGMAPAQAMADAECGKHGRMARWVSGDINYVFDCVL
jgi:hypothetical protein